MDVKNEVIQYANWTLSSEDVGTLQRLASERFLRDMTRDDLIVDWAAVERLVKFFSMLKHDKGRFHGQSFRLEPWQLFILANIIGFKWVETGRRRFTSSYIEVARKNGKTMLSAGLCLYYLIADHEHGAEVDLAANSREQAEIAFSYCSDLAKQIDPVGKALKRYRKEIKFGKMNSILNCFAADATTLDGFNASFALIDEYHSAPDSSVRDVLKSSMGMRLDPHLATITTAGFNKHYPCYELHSACVDLLNGVSDDDSLFCLIFAPDAGDEWTDPRTWRKANPNLGVTVTEQYIATQVKNAQLSPTEAISTKTKHLNMWCDSSVVWIPDKYLQDSFVKEVEFYEGEVVYCGVDLAATGDLTAVAFMTIRGDEYIFKVRYYLPASKLESGKNASKYRQWAEKGHLIITDGNVTDYDRITEEIVGASERVTLVGIAYDSWNATQWAIDCTARGLPLVPYSQSLGNFNRPTKEFERLILSGRAKLEYNEVTSFCFSNVVLKVDANGNSKPSKENYENKIDGTIVIIESLGCYLAKPNAGGGDIFVF